jgi:predicted TIM-barrel fold metal-dependent hydrolase
MLKIDSHLHVWAHEPDKYPYRAGGGEPSSRGDVEYLLELQEEAGVSGALIVQPIFHGFDHRYVTDVLRRYPDRFVGMALADPVAPDAVDQLRRLVEEDGYRGVRLNPNLWPDSESMDGATGYRLMEYCAEAQIAAGFLIDPSHFADVSALCKRYPEATTIIDHFGRVGPDRPDDIAALIDLHKHPNLYVKVSGFPVSSRQEWPYADMSGVVHRLIDAFGVERLMFATDFPHIVRQCGYSEGWEIADRIKPSLDDKQRKRIMAGTVNSIFGAWADTPA